MYEIYNSILILLIILSFSALIKKMATNKDDSNNRKRNYSVSSSDSDAETFGADTTTDEQIVKSQNAEVKKSKTEKIGENIVNFCNKCIFNNKTTKESSHRTDKIRKTEKIKRPQLKLNLNKPCNTEDTTPISNLLANTSINSNSNEKVNDKIKPIHIQTIRRTNSESSIDNNNNNSILQAQNGSSSTKDDTQINELAKYLCVNSRIFSKLHYTDIIRSMNHCQAEISTEKSLRIVPGVNFLSICKNGDCRRYFKDIIWPRGMYEERNGNISLDREIHKIKCPICKQQITHDGTLGIGFYKCSINISYSLTDGKVGNFMIKSEHYEGYFLYGRCNRSDGQLYKYLDCHVSDALQRSIV